MARPEIYFPRPCPVKTSQMQACQGGFYCGICQKKVADLRKASLDTITGFVQDNPGACMVTDARTLEPRPPAVLQKYKLWKGFAFLVGLCFFLSSCHHRRKYTVGGCPSFKQNPAGQQTEQTQQP